MSLYETSSLGHALQAIALLKAAGHTDAAMTGVGLGHPQHTISVSTDKPGAAFEVLRLVQAVDPSARPLE